MPQNLTGTDAKVCDLVIGIVREVVAKHSPALLEAIRKRLAEAKLIMTVEAGRHSGLDVWCPAFGPVSDPGVLASTAAGGPERAARALKLLADPPHRMVAAVALAEFLWKPEPAAGGAIAATSEAKP